MRIAIPQYEGAVSGAYELSQVVSMHLLDFGTLTAKDEGVHPFPAVAESYDWLEDQEVQAIVLGTIDPDNAEKLAERGIHVFTGAGDLTPAETVEQFLSAMAAALKRQSEGGCCGGHGHDDDSEGCCGGKGHAQAEGEEHECCGGKGHDDGSECCGGKGHAH